VLKKNGVWKRVCKLRKRGDGLHDGITSEDSFSVLLTVVLELVELTVSIVVALYVRID